MITRIYFKTTKNYRTLSTTKYTPEQVIEIARTKLIDQLPEQKTFDIDYLQKDWMPVTRIETFTAIGRKKSGYKSLTLYGVDNIEILNIFKNIINDE